MWPFLYSSRFTTGMSSMFFALIYGLGGRRFDAGMLSGALGVLGGLIDVLAGRGVHLSQCTQTQCDQSTTTPLVCSFKGIEPQFKSQRLKKNSS